MSNAGWQGPTRARPSRDPRDNSLTHALRRGIADAVNELDAAHHPMWVAPGKPSSHYVNEAIPGRAPIGCVTCYPEDSSWPCVTAEVADDLRCLADPEAPCQDHDHGAPVSTGGTLGERMARADAESAFLGVVEMQPEPGACGDPACPVLHADPTNPVHPPGYVDSRTVPDQEPKVTKVGVAYRTACNDCGWRSALCVSPETAVAAEREHPCTIDRPAT